MVLDSADDPDVFYNTNDKGKQTAITNGEKRPLWTYLPQSSNGSILVTTRSRELALKLTGGHKYMIEVGPMDKDHALELLAAKSGSQYDNEDGLKLVEALECMPLAISQAAAYIQERAPRVSVKTYLNQFQESEQSRLSLLNRDAGDLRRDGSASNSVIITWQISFDFIGQKRPSATSLLSLMSFFDCEGIQEYLVQPWDLFRKSVDEIHSGNRSTTINQALDPEFEEDVKMLRSYCLIKTNETGSIFEMHRLVQLSTRKWLDLHGETEIFKEQYISRMADAFPYSDFENWGICRQLLPHAEKTMDYRPTNTESLINWSFVLYKCGYFFVRQGKFPLAETFLTLSWRVGETTLGPEHPDTLSSMGELAYVYREQRQLPEAESLSMQALEISKRVLGPEHLRTLAVTNNLALTYIDQKRFKEAELLHLHVLEVNKKVLGAEHQNTLTAMHNLASIYMKQGRLEESEPLFLQVLELRKKVIGPEHPGTLMSMAFLAFICFTQGRLEESESLQLQVLEIGK
ncbi:hypothetical protein RRF57_005037 [Xylaria bambusicola]|uniref:DUF7779 domain-containing protein n=1 Tax=Xylaria bambusicola TaxID=326684 RepID=A0AAN7UIV6_9PEZI